MTAKLMRALLELIMRFEEDRTNILHAEIIC